MISILYIHLSNAEDQNLLQELHAPARVVNLILNELGFYKIEYAKQTTN